MTTTKKITRNRVFVGIVALVVTFTMSGLPSLVNTALAALPTSDLSTTLTIPSEHIVDPGMTTCVDVATLTIADDNKAFNGIYVSIYNDANFDPDTDMSSLEQPGGSAPMMISTVPYAQINEGSDVTHVGSLFTTIGNRFVYQLSPVEGLGPIVTFEPTTYYVIACFAQTAVAGHRIHFGFHAGGPSLDNVETEYTTFDGFTEQMSPHHYLTSTLEFATEGGEPPSEITEVNVNGMAPDSNVLSSGDLIPLGEIIVSGVGGSDTLTDVRFVLVNDVDFNVGQIFNTFPGGPNAGKAIIFATSQTLNLGELTLPDDLQNIDTYALMPSAVDFTEAAPNTYKIDLNHVSAESPVNPIPTAPATASYYFYGYIRPDIDPNMQFSLNIDRITTTELANQAVAGVNFGTFAAEDDGPPPDSSFSLVAYGPSSGSLGQFSPVDFFFNQDLSPAVKSDPGSFFEISPAIEGQWTTNTEFWGADTIYRVGFMPLTVWEDGVSYEVRVYNNVDNAEEVSFEVNLGAGDGFEFPDLSVGDGYKYFTVTGSAESGGGNYPPIVVGGYPQNGGQNVSTGLQQINIEFDRSSMDATTFTEDNIYLVKVLPNSSEVALENLTISPNTGISRTASITGFTLEPNSKYKIYVTRDVMDDQGVRILGNMVNGQPMDYSSIFFTGNSSVGIQAQFVGTNLYAYKSPEGIVNVPVSEIIKLNFNNPLTASSIENNVTITPSLGCGENGDLSLVYDADSFHVLAIPNCIMSPSTEYDLSYSDFTSVTGTAVAPNTLTFTTGVADEASPSLVSVIADDYGPIIEFSENITDTSALNKGNYELKTRNDDTPWALADVVSLASAKLSYDQSERSVDMQISLTPGYEYQLTLSSSIVDLSDNPLNTEDNANVWTNFVLDSSKLNGGDGVRGSDSVENDPSLMGMSPINVMPLNKVIGQSSIYVVQFPVSQQIESGGTIQLRFPQGFNVANVEQDAFSPNNGDFNKFAPGKITFSNSDPTGNSNGVDGDGISIIGDRTVVVELNNSTLPQDFLVFDIAGIVNPSTVAQNWKVDIMTFNHQGVLLEGLTSSPFSTSAGGTNTLNVSLDGFDLGVNKDVNVTLFSPKTGKINKVASVVGDGVLGVADASVSFGNVEDGFYQLTSDSNVFVDESTQYVGPPFADMVSINGGSIVNKNIVYNDPSNEANTYSVVAMLIGNFSTDGSSDAVDIFAGSKNNFKKYVRIPGDTEGSTVTFNLPDGEWNIGIGPALTGNSSMIPKTDWIPPPNVLVKVWNNGQNASLDLATFDISSMDTYVVTGTVTDETSAPLSDVEVYAYQPMGNFGKIFTKTLSDGSYTLNIGWPGNYIVGVIKNGLPDSAQKSIQVVDDVPNVNFVMKKPAHTISGTLKDQNSNNVSNSPVWTYQTEGGFGNAATMTDSSGNFVLYVDDGTWTVEANAPGVGWIQYVDPIVIDGESVSNIIVEPNSDVEFITIAGSVAINGAAYAYGPIRAVAYNEQGQQLNQQFGGQTDADGNYTITAPVGIYRVDIWAPGYGEIERTDADDYPASPANVNATEGSVEGVDINVGADNLFDVSIDFINADPSEYSDVDAMVILEAFDVATNKPTGYKNNKFIHDISDSEGDTSIKLKAGNYKAFVSIPGYGDYIPLEAQSTSPTTPGYIDVGDDSQDLNTLNIELPVAANLITVAGTVRDSGESTVENAWVTINNMTKGFNHGIATDADGAFSIKLPRLETGNYSISAGKPGYMSVQPVAVSLADANSDGIADASYDITLNAQENIISGYIFADKAGGTNDSYDSGEGLPYGMVEAQETTTGLISTAPVDGSGYFELGVVAGTWELFGGADGYDRTQYEGTLEVDGADLTERNIELVVREGWNKKLSQNPMTLNLGGTFDDTSTTGNGVKLVVPANAMGTSSASGSINISGTTAVSTTNTHRPFGFEGKSITATDENGQAITVLNDYIDIEMLIWKTDVDNEITSGRMTDFNDLLSASLSYFDNSTNNWVSLATTRTAYYLPEGSSEWEIYTSGDATLSDYEAFITDALINETFTDFDDYKLVFTSKTDHLTTFGVTTNLGVAGGDEEEEQGNAPRNGGGAADVAVITKITIDKATNVTLAATATPIVLTNSGTMNFISSGLNHSLSLKSVDVTGQSVTLTLASNPIDVTVKLNKTEQVDINKDGVNDIEISLTAINTSMNVDLTVKTLMGASIVLPANEEQPEQIIPGQQPNLPLSPTSFLPAKGGVISIIAEQQALTEFVALTKYEPTTQADNWVVDYLAYGNSTKTTAMNARERKGVLEDFINIYGNLPKNESDWKALAQVADGSTTPKRVLAQEVKAIKEFFKIFKKNVNFKEQTNELFVHKLAYRLRAEQRDLAKEKTALQKFIKVYKKNPWDGYAWSIVRALAYSGILNK